MSVITVGLEDTFNDWRLKTNQISALVGNQSSLQTSASDIVSAINEIRTNATINGGLNTYGDTFTVNIDSGDSAELVLDANGNLTLSGRLIADVTGNLYGNAATATKLAVARIITMTGDGSWNTTFDGSANVTGSLTLNNTGVTAGTYTKVTVNAGGRVTAATALSSTDINTALGGNAIVDSTGYTDPSWLTSLSAGKLTAGSSATITNLTLSNRLLVSNGSATNPSIAWNADTGQDTGFYWGGDGYTYFSNNGVKSGEIQPGGNLVMVGDVSSYSDISIKKNIETIKDALDIVNSFRGIYYDTIDTNERKIGVVAQEAQVRAPELVRLGSDGKLTVAYGNMGGLLLQAINELTERVKAIEAKLV
jgi:hypothetical protein